MANVKEMASPGKNCVYVKDATGKLFSDKAHELFEAIRDERYGFLLDSSSLPNRLGRYSILGYQPMHVLQAKSGKYKIITTGRSSSYNGDPLEKLEELLALNKVEYSGNLPFVGGAVGYLSYDLCQLTENMKLDKPDETGMPDMEFGFYEKAVVCDNLKGTVCLTSCGKTLESCKAGIGELTEKFRKKPDTTADRKNIIKSKVKSNFTKPGYLRTVEKIKDYIRAGDTYQVNLSQNFTTTLKENPWRVYKRLRNINPAPFAAYLNYGKTRILSSSPERFLKVKDRTIETRPIKGTRPRGADEKEDRKLARELLSSEKDKAEHVMIVDLERNDLGKVCEYESVHVPEFEILETYPTVHHMVSTVRGRLRQGTSIIDCIRACFPGGSITGAPKIRAMEIINELEPTRRNLYTGAVGYLGFNGAMDLNIAIRTIICTPKTTCFSAGGGIVADSKPEAEYDETIHKARALFQVLGVIV
ncbi:MAG: aminodeoxychorismate synthase component I [Candidatus Altiarchaeota archaeon]|nr:aminodeoxychorismate synthase component I [Candidatus Altiarchaeota archaeon]